MKVKVGDKVRVLAGKDKGKEGTVTATLKKDNKVVVSGVNVVKRHMKPNAYNADGGIIEKEAPIHVSNVKVLENKKSEKKVEKATKEEKTTKTAKATTKKETAKKTTTKKTAKKESGER